MKHTSTHPQATLRVASLVFALLLTGSFLRAQPGTIDPSFNPSDRGFGMGDGANLPIRAQIRQPDGKILILGHFSSYNGIIRRNIARLNADGSLDLSFDPGTSVGTGILYTMALQPDGKILLGGIFQTYNGIPRNNIARLNADGSLDTSFNPGTGTDNEIHAIAVQPDGKIFIGGAFTRYNGTAQNRITRLNPDGSLDANFDPGTGAIGTIYSLVLQSDGKILIGGKFTSYNGMPRNNIARLNANGSLDTSFDPGTGASDSVHSISLQPDGKVLIGGYFTSYNSSPRRGIARLNADGSLDTGFNPGTGVGGDNYGILAIVSLTDGKIFIGGGFTSYNGTARNRIARLNPDGSLDQGFNPGTGAEGTDSPVNVITLLPDGKILIGGAFTSYNGTPSNRIARLNADGGLDPSFNPSTGINPDYVHAINVLPDGKILTGGNFSSYNGTTRRGLARLNADGSLDTSFDPGTGVSSTFQYEIFAIAVLPNGKYLIGGTFTSYNGIPRNQIALLNPDGSLDQSFNPAPLGIHTVRAIALQSDGKILVGGGSSAYLFRLNADGSRDTGFDSFGAIRAGFVYALAVQPDGKILVGGGFSIPNLSARNRIARLNPNGSLDISFDPGAGANNTVYTLLLQPDGKILIGGDFTNINGTSRNRIARLNADGRLDTGFDPGAGANNSIINIALQPNGKILIGGAFTSYNGTPRNRLARLNADGSLDTGFDPGAGANHSISDVALQPDGQILIGGFFTSYDFTGRNRLARVNGGEGVSDGTCLALGDECSGNEQEIRRYTLSMPTGGSYPLTLSYRSHERATQLRLRINGGPWQSLPLAQTASASTYVVTNLGSMVLQGGANTIELASGGGYVCFRQLCADTPPSPQTQCLALGDECSGNDREIRRYTLNMPTGGNFPLFLSYRSHERATQLRLRINGGSWLSLPLAQTASASTYVVANLGSMALQGGANTIELASGGGYVCFRQLCAENPIPPQLQCMPLGDACSGNEQEIQRYTLNVSGLGSYPVLLSYRSHERSTQLRLRINGGSWQSLPLPQTASASTFVVTQLANMLLQLGANTIELASGGGYVCFRELCVGERSPVSTRIGLPETEAEASQKLTVSPNPGGGEFVARFYAEPGRAAVLEVVDMQGRRLWHRGLRGEGWHDERVSLPHAAAGTYLLLLHPDEANARGRKEYKRVVIVK